MMRTIYLHIEPWMNRLMLVSFFLPHKWQTFIFIFFTGWVLLNAIEQKVWLTRNECFMALILGGAYLFYIAYIPLTEPNLRHIVYSLLERKVSLLIMPFIIPLALKLGERKISVDLKYFAFANILHGAFINLLVLFVSLGSTAEIDHVFYRNAFEDAAGIHPTYYGMYVCLSCAILLYDQQLKKWPVFVLISSQFLLVFFLFLLSPKILLLIAGLLYLYHFLFEVKLKFLPKIVLFFSAVAIIIVSFVTIPFFHQRITEVTHFINDERSNAIENSMMFRKMIFDIDLNLLKDDWLFGIGPARLQQNLDMAYAMIWNMTGVPLKSYNTHNEYLNQWLSFGIAGLLYMILVFLMQLRLAILRVDKLYIVTMFIIMFTCLTENILSRQQGVLFVALFTALFYFEITTTKDAEKRSVLDR